MFKKLKRFPWISIPVLILLFLALLSGCGGDGPINDTPTPGTGGTSTPTGSIILSLAKLSDNSPTTSVSVDSPAKLTATASDSAGHRIVLKIISFSTTSDLLFEPASVTALTDANGTASITVKAGKTTGATTIKAEITDNSGNPISGTISLAVTGTGTVTEPIILSLTNLSDNSAATSVSVGSPAKLTVTAKDSSGQPIAFQVMSFSTTSDLSFDPASGTALTDANGIASITVKAGNTTGATTIRAEITDKSGNPVSGTISLAMAPPNLSLSVLTINPAVLSAGGSAGISVTVNDGAGNPITTSVPVSFTTTGVQAGKATITQQVNTVNGVASATYRDINFGAVDTITATLSIGGITFVKTGTITVNPAPEGSIVSFLTKPSDNSTTTSVSVDSPAKLTVTAKDSSGQPIASRLISFSTTSDLSFDPASGLAFTDANGTASITVKAGNTAGDRIIRAEITDSFGTTVSGTINLTVIPPNVSLSALTINPIVLSTGGTAGISVTVNDGSGSPVAIPLPVFFTSEGVQAGKATITSPVYTVNGVASATYRDINYGTVDTITASLSVGGTISNRTGTISVIPAAAGTISFISATPDSIALKGTGGAGRSETSVVVFKVLDTNGNPMKKKVNFSLDTAVGGLTLTANSADSDPVSGLVQTIVNAGTANTPVRVSATIDGTTITTTSDNLVVSTGIPDQDSFSLAASILNIEGWGYDGITSDITVRLADHFHNPVPNGTAVKFRTSGGSIQPSCTTTSGACTVQFTSQAPRPPNGRAVIFADVLGEESFIDLNGNGQYDIGDTFTDLPEAYLDANENGARDGNEEFIDTNSDGSYSLGDGRFNGILRDPSIIAPKTIHISKSLTIVLSGSDATITINNGNPISLAHCTDGVAFNNAQIKFDVIITDVNGNVLPEGTTISFTTTNGTILTTPTSYKVPNTSAKIPPTYPIIMQSDATQSAPPTLTCSNAQANGIFTVTVTTPKGLSTYGTIAITD